ncbi:MAG: hypothetical protein ABI632_00490 [Pseudolysinimonas sp.]
MKALRAQLLLVSAFAAVLAMIVGFSCGIAGYLDTATREGVRAAFSSARGADGSVRADIRRTDDPTAQDAAVRRIITAAFGRVPMVVTRSVESDPLTVSIADSDVELVVASYPDLRSNARLVTGEWGGKADVVLQADAATALHLHRGDTITLPGGRPVTLSGTWRAIDASDPSWFGEDLAAGGFEATAFGPLVVDESLWSSLDITPFARWTVRPDPARVTPAQVGSIIAGAAALPADLAADPAAGTTNVVYGGGLASLAARLSGSLGALAGVAPVSLILVGAIGLVALLELARLLASARAAQDALLRSRGASIARLVRSAAIEALGVSAVAAAIGAAVAWALTGALSWLIPIAVVAAAVVVVAVTTGHQHLAPAGRQLDSGRSRTVVGLGLTVLLVVAATVSVWQFRLYGSPVVRGADGRASVDPVAVLAPALPLVACAAIAVALFAPFSAGAERRSRTFGGSLATRQVARRVSVFTTAILLVCLATGGLTFVAVYSATWQRATIQADEVANGAAVRAIAGSAQLGTISAVSGVDAAAPVLATELQLGDTAVQLVAVDADRIPAVVLPAAGLIDTGALAAALHGDGVRLAITTQLAAHGDLRVGGRLVMRFTGSGRELSGTISAIVPAIPGVAGPYAAMADLAAVAVQQGVGGVPTTEVWIATNSPATVATNLRVLRVEATTVDVSPRLLESAREALWVGGAGGLVLAAAAASAIATALLRSRTNEVIVLRAIGLAAREQAATRSREFVIVLAYAIAAGILSGLLTSWLVAGGLARAAVLDPQSDTALAIDPAQAAAALAVLIATLLTVIASYSARVRRQAITLPAREYLR